MRIYSKIPLFASVLFICCSKSPHIDIAGGEEETPGVTQSSVAYIKSFYRGTPTVISQEIDIYCYVASSDKYGNFYKSLFAEDDTGGIELKLDRTDIYLTYSVGTKLLVRCNGLTIGAYGGMVQLGASTDGDYEVGYLSDREESSHIAKIELPTVEYKALNVTIPSLTDSHIGRFVLLNNVQFAEWDTTEDGSYSILWCENGETTNRTLVDPSGNTLSVRTNYYAMFAGWVLPKGSGSIEGVLTVFNGEYQLLVSNPHNAVMGSDRF